MTWPEARIYCEDLEKGGYADWRLPTISELRTLVKDCESIMTGGACKITDDILSIPEEGDFRFNLHSCYDPALYDDSCKFENSQNFSIFNDAVALWSSSPVENTNYDSVWTIYFNNEQKIPGGLSDRDKNEQNRVHTRCVRSTR